MVTAKTYGKDFNYFKRLSISNTGFSTDADFVVPFRGESSIVLINESSNTIEYSFNGHTTHGDLVPNTPCSALAFYGRAQSCIWFKVASGVASNIRIEAFCGEFAGMFGTTPTAGGSTQIAGNNDLIPAVKAASTAAEATDQALVVAISPNNIIPVIEQNAALAEDNTNGVFAVAYKPLATSTYAPLLLADFGSNVTKNVKSSTGNIFGINGTNANASTRWLQIHNTASTPSGGAVPIMSFMVLTGSSINIGNNFFTLAGYNFSTGIAYAWSTAAGTYTAATASDHTTMVIYK